MPAVFSCRILLNSMIFVIVSALPSALTAKTLVVDSAQCPGPPDSVYCSVQEAIDDAASGDIITVRAGHYDGFVVNREGLTVKSYADETVYIDGEQALMLDENRTVAASVMLAASDVTLDGFIIKDGRETGVFVLGNNRNLQLGDTAYEAAMLVDGVTIINNTISGFKPDPEKPGTEDRGYGIFVYGSNIVIPDSPTVPDGNTKNVTIGSAWDTGNSIGGNHRGIGVLGDVPGLVIHYNSLSGNDDCRSADAVDTGGHALGHYYPASEKIDATKNWWGDATGPSDSCQQIAVYDACPASDKEIIVADGMGDQIYFLGEICFYPWCTSENCSEGQASDNNTNPSDNDTTPITQLPLLSVNGFVNFGTEDTIKTIVIRNTTAAGTLTWSTGAVEYSSGDAWITGISPASGSLLLEQEIVISISRTALAPGNYAATLPIVSNGGNDSVLIRMVVDGPDVVPNPEFAVMYIDPTTIDFSSDETLQLLTITNTGDADLSWTAAIDYDNESGWISSDATSGALAPGDHQAVMVRISRQGLRAGFYGAVLTISDGAGTDSAVNIVMVNVGTPQLLVEKKFEANTGNVSGVFLNRRNNYEAALKLQSIADGIVMWEIGEIDYFRRSQGWLAPVAQSGVLTGIGDETLVRLSADISTLRPGLHRAIVSIDSNGGQEQVRVFLRVPWLGR